MTRETSQVDLRVADPTRRRYAFASELLQARGQGLTLLDVGGGAGEFAALARGAGYSTVLVDGSLANVRAEEARGYPARNIDLNLGLPGLPSGSFDVVVALEIIEHVLGAERLLSEMHRVLRDDGSLILSTPNTAFYVHRLQALLGGDVPGEGYHCRFFTGRSLAAAVNRAGFAVVATNSMAGTLGITRMVALLTGGRVRLPKLRSPSVCESWLASTLVWRLRKRAVSCR